MANTDKILTAKRNIPFSPPDISELEIAEVAEALRSGWITTGPRTKEFERRLAAYCHTSRVVCLNSATAAEELNFRICGIGEGDEVIVPAYTYSASASAAIHCGARVVFVDSQKDNCEIDHPDVYIESNLIGFYNILEACRNNPVAHLVYASSSSVYGGNKKVPFSTDDKVDNPVSLYAATKKSNELLAHAYSKLYDIPSTGLRFFTVYGPAGRPDMFYYSATQKLVAGKTIQIFNYGNCKRDFTYIDDIVEGVYRVMQGAPDKSTGADGLPVPPYAVYNIGGGTPENLLDYISTLQEELVRAGVLPADYDFEGHRELVGMQPGDVPVTYADSAALERDYGFTPSIGIREGLRRFAEWYAAYSRN